MIWSVVGLQPDLSDRLGALLFVMSQNILLVCRGNLCRSPMALGVLNVLAARDGMAGRVRFDSAGTHAQRGNPPDLRAVRAAKGRGYEIAKLRSKAVQAKHFESFDLILAMDRYNLSALQGACPAFALPKVALFLTFAGVVLPDEVPDPYYGSEAGFERVLDLCEEAGRKLIDSLKCHPAQ